MHGSKFNLIIIKILILIYILIIESESVVRETHLENNWETLWETDWNPKQNNHLFDGLEEGKQLIPSLSANAFPIFNERLSPKISPKPSHLSPKIKMKGSKVSVNIPGSGKYKKFFKKKNPKKMSSKVTRAPPSQSQYIILKPSSNSTQLNVTNNLMVFPQTTTDIPLKISITATTGHRPSPGQVSHTLIPIVDNNNEKIKSFSLSLIDVIAFMITFSFVDHYSNDTFFDTNLSTFI